MAGSPLFVARTLHSQTFTLAQVGRLFVDGSIPIAKLVGGGCSIDFGVGPLKVDDIQGSTGTTGNFHVSMVDNLADALTIRQGGNDYIKFRTSNATEKVSFGNATTNPAYEFLGSGATDFGGAVTALGLINNSTLDQNAFVDMDTTQTGTSSAFALDTTINHATQTAVGMDVSIAQITNVRTAGDVIAYKGTVTSFDGTSAGVDHVVYDARCVVGDVDSDHIVLRQLAGFSHTIDSRAASSGEVRWALPDAAANALTIEDSAGNDFILIDTAAADRIVLGNATTNPSVLVLGNGGTDVSAGTLLLGAATATGVVTLDDGSLLQRSGAGTGTGDAIEVLGPDATHGMVTTVYEATVAPAAIETALFTIPAMSVVESVQANVETALTGGGTTVSFSVGITGDIDLYGTATTAGVQADLLTQNAKIDSFGRRAADAGAGLGLFVAAAQSLKLIGAAAGGAAAGDTALTVGTVKVRVVYQTLLSVANA